MDHIKTISVPNILFDKYFKLLNPSAIKSILGTIYQSFLYRAENIELSLKELVKLLKIPLSSLERGLKESSRLGIIGKNKANNSRELNLEKNQPYTPIPIAFFKNILPELSGAELKLALAVTRNQFGWNGKPKRNKTISNKQLMTMTGLSKSSLLLSRKSLKEKNILCQKQENSSFAYDLILEKISSIKEGAPQNHTSKPSKLVLKTLKTSPISSVSKKEEKKKEKQTGEKSAVVYFSQKEEEVKELLTQKDFPEITSMTIKALAQYSLDLIKSSISHISKNIEKIYNPIGFLIKSLKENWQFISPKDIEDEHVKWAKAHFSKLEGHSIPIRKIQGVCFTVSLLPNQGKFIISCGPKVISVPYKFKEFKASAKALYEAFLNGSSPAVIQEIPGVSF